MAVLACVQRAIHNIVVGSGMYNLNTIKLIIGGTDTT